MARKYGFYINGQFVHAKQWKRVPNALEASESLGEVSYLDSLEDPESQEIWEACLEGVSLTFEQIQFNGFFPLEERLAFLKRLSKRLEEQKENLAQLIMQEIGKPIALARAEVDRAVLTINETLTIAPRFFQQQHPLPFEQHSSWKGFEGYWTREARGPLLAICPFNFPVNLVIHKLAPALAAGCPVVLKPSDKASLVALCLADYCHAEGLPAGLLNVINCSNELSSQLIQDPRIKHVSFTGSSKIGWQLRKLTHKPFFLELGGAAPVFVDDINKLDIVADQLAQSAFAYAGQTCISTQSIWVHENIYQEFITAFTKAIDKIKCGLPSHEEVLCGALISKDAFERVQKLDQQAHQEGARSTQSRNEVITEGSINPYLFEKTGWKDLFFQPRFYEGLPTPSKLLSEEAFAPFVALQKISSFTEFVRVANSLDHRLQCAVYSQSQETLKQAASQLRYGGVILNAPPSTRFDPMPYGGRDLAGSGREGPMFALEDYTEIKSVVRNTQTF